MMGGLRSPARLVAVVGVLLLLLLPSALGGPGSPAITHSSSASGPRLPAVRAVTAGGAGPVPSKSAPSAPGVTASPLVERVERQIQAGAFDGRNAFLPSPFVHSADPVQGAAVTPNPLSSPAPMGVADLGIGPSGAPYIYDTSSFAGTVQFTSYSAESAGYAEFAEAPDWTTIQLNAVGTNITYPGSATGTFWFQNVVHFNGSELQFEDNIWNFSSRGAFLPPRTIFSHGANGTIQLDEFYYDYGPSFHVSDPFSLTLSMRLAAISGLPTVQFNYSLTTGGTTHVGTYDTVSFDGVAVPVPVFQVNGGAYNPFGSEYDAELEIGGDGGGTNANIVSLAGSATLDSWNASSHRYAAVPSAYDHGVDSGETSTGVAAYYPSNLSATEFLNPGPSILYGLWNTSSGPAGPEALPGSIGIDLDLSPIYAFAFVTTFTDSMEPLANANFSYAPSDSSGVVSTRLPPPRAADPYVVRAWADGFLNGSLTVGSSTTTSLMLTSSPSTFDAPVYLDGDAQAAAFGAAKLPGTGYASTAGTLWINASTANVAAPFLRVNGFDYPTFVLFVAERLTLGIHVDGFVQSLASFVYSSSYSGIVLPPDGWTQGYFFFSGSGRFSVANTTLTGNSTLYYHRSIYSPATVEFYGTTDSSAANILALQDSFGVAALDSKGTVLRDISSEEGANAISIVNSTGVTAVGTLTNGVDYAGAASIGILDYRSTDLTVTGLTAQEGAYGVETQGGSGITASDVAATTVVAARPAYAFLLNGTNDVTDRGLLLSSSDGVLSNNSSDQSFSNISATLSPLTGLWQNATDLRVENLTSTTFSVGVEFQDDSAVTVINATAVGSSTAIDEFDSSSAGVFNGVHAINGSIGLQAELATGVTVSNVSAENGSVGAYLQNATGVNAVGLTATNLSDGLLWNFGSTGTVSAVSVGNASLGVEVSNATNFTIRDVNASESALGDNASHYILNPLTFQTEPSAAVALYDSSHATVENVTAHNYPFAVWANDTNLSTIEQVRAYSGYIGIALNTTTGDEIASAFLYGNVLGANLSNTSGTLVTASTFEESSSYGVQLLNGSFDHIEGNNFVANNGADTKGTFSATHVQASANGTNIFFNGTGVGNFWSDRASGAYVVRSAAPIIKDTAPVALFIHHWLEFVAVGLPVLTPWGVSLLGIDFPATQPLLYLPTWSLPDTSYLYTVLPTPGFVPTPASGRVPLFPNTNLTITIDFATLYTVSFAETGLPASVSWSVTLNGVTTTGKGSPIAFSELDGSYSYAILRVNGWTEKNVARTGTVVVAGADVNERSITWTETVFSVTFSETGLSGKPKWTVTMNGTPLSGTSASIAFSVPNGTYAFAVTSPSGYSAGPAIGRVVVDNSDPTVLVTFNATAHPAAASIPWLYVGVGVGALVVVIAVVALLRSRRRDGPPGYTPPEF